MSRRLISWMHIFNDRIEANRRHTVSVTQDDVVRTDVPHGLRKEVGMRCSRKVIRMTVGVAVLVSVFVWFSYIGLSGPFGEATSKHGMDACIVARNCC